MIFQSFFGLNEKRKKRNRKTTLQAIPELYPNRKPYSQILRYYSYKSMTHSRKPLNFFLF